MGLQFLDKADAASARLKIQTSMYSKICCLEIIVRAPVFFGGKDMRFLIVIAALASVAFAGEASAQSFRPLPAATTLIPLGDDNDIPVTLPFAVRMGAEAAGNLFSLSQNAFLYHVNDNAIDRTIYFADLETRTDTGQANYGVSTVNGHPAFIATYANVGYCCGLGDPRRENVQIVVIDRSDIGAGDFDYEVNTQGLSEQEDPTPFFIDAINVGRAGVAAIPAGTANAYRSIYTFRAGALTSGTGPTIIAPPATVPTMSEWAMILFGLTLAGGAALYIQRRRFIA